MEILTAAQSEADQRRIAGGLLAAGLERGDRVALLTTSSGRMLSAILGALRVGIVPVLLNSGLLEHERAALLDDAQPQLLVDDAALARLLTADPVELAPHPLARPMHYTSGTTGTPKGVWSGILTGDEAAGLVREEAELWQFAPDDVHLVCSPFHHSVAIRFGGGTLLAGGTVVILGKFDADDARRALAEHRPTTTFMVPAHLQRLFAGGAGSGGSGARDHGLVVDSLRLVVHAGAPCPAPLKLAAIDVFGVDRVWEFYGSTEGQFTACAASEWLDHRGSVGRARPHRTLEVDDDGTIWCTVPAYARYEYWRDADKTATSWRPAAPSRPDAFGAFTVGDLGRLDDDGYLFIEGRRSDLIITGGVNVYPAEIEAVLGRHEGVTDVAVFAVDDEQWGQRVCAAVVGEVSIDELATYARAHLAGYKRPKAFYVVDELPHTATGKLQRGQVAGLVGLAD